MLFATGTENSGIAFFVKDDHLVFDYNAFDHHTIIRSDSPIPDGATTLHAQFLRGRSAPPWSRSPSTATSSGRARSRG